VLGFVAVAQIDCGFDRLIQMDPAAMLNFITDDGLARGV
jgi:hypothetical protein